MLSCNNISGILFLKLIFYDGDMKYINGNWSPN